MFEAFGFGQPIHKANDHSVVSRRRQYVRVAVEQFLCLDTSNAQRYLIDERQMIGSEQFAICRFRRR